METIICFDMDGTIVDFYNVPNWLKKIREGDPSPYQEAEPLVNMDKLNETCMLLKKAGYEIQVITSLSKDATPEFKKAIRTAKKEWLEKWGFIYDHFHGVDYKTAKQEVMRHQLKKTPAEAILVDDEPRHTDQWKWGRTINPKEIDIIQALRELLPTDLI